LVIQALTAAMPTARSTVLKKPCLTMQGLIAEGEENIKADIEAM
jgi:hypothetical protein